MILLNPDPEIRIYVLAELTLKSICPN